MVFVGLLFQLGLCVSAQQAGHYETEGNPTITYKQCTIADGCKAETRKVVLDANWRWIHSTSGYDNCYTGNQWDSKLCPDPATCARNCALEQISQSGYESTYGITNVQDGFKIKFQTDHRYGTNVGGRLYMLNQAGDEYEMFFLNNREFSIELDVSNLFCGMNGAMYFVEMDRKGDYGVGNNQAGAKFGTGYCDAQCPHDMKWIKGEPNIVDWISNPKDFSNNMGTGRYGSCCAEMDIWEANSMANAYTPHPCSIGDEGQVRCEGIDCGDTDKGERYKGICDKDGCDINPYRMGNRTFYGRGEEFSVNTLKPMTVVTQFITEDGTDDGDLVEIRRHYVQDEKVIPLPPTTILPAGQNTDSITDEFCAHKKQLFQDVDDYKRHGGTKNMGDSHNRGHVIAMSLWDDVEVNMMWLDSWFPRDKPRNAPGVERGACPGGVDSSPQSVRAKHPDGWTSFKNVAIGEIGSTLLKTTGGGGGDGGGPAESGCQPKPGTNQAECKGNSEARCRQMMMYENKCTWIEPATPKPTPSPTPMPIAPTPTPTPPQGTDCRQFCGRTNIRLENKWCNAFNGDEAGCTKAFILNGNNARHCMFETEKCKTDKTKTLECPNLEEICAEGPGPEPEPEPEPTPAPTPGTNCLPQLEGCLAFCGLTNLKDHKRGCKWLKMFPRLCKASYMHGPTGAVQKCEWTGTTCDFDRKDMPHCPNLVEDCAKLAASMV